MYNCVGELKENGNIVKVFKQNFMSKINCVQFFSVKLIFENYSRTITTIYQKYKPLTVLFWFLKEL